MKLKKTTPIFIKEVLEEYEGNELNNNILKLFKTFNNDGDKYNVLIKVATLNKIYSTAIVNIKPVVEQIIKISKLDSEPKTIPEYVLFVDKISSVSWTNEDGKTFTRKNLSFASKYVHFLSEFKMPIYDSYIWIIIKGYLGQKNNTDISFKAPKNYNEFYSVFQFFKKEMDVENYSNYEIDKFLWQYGKNKLVEIQKRKTINLEKAKTELKKAIKTT